MISLPQRSVRIAAAEMDGPHGKSFPSSSSAPSSVVSFSGIPPECFYRMIADAAGCSGGICSKVRSLPTNQEMLWRSIEISAVKFEKIGDHGIIDDFYGQADGFSPQVRTFWLIN